MKTGYNETLILTTGAEAQKVVNILYSKNPELNYLYLDEEKLIINTNKNKTIWFGNLKYQKTEYDIEDYKNILLKRVSKFNEIISDYKNIIIVSCIGEKNSSATLFEVIKHMDNLKIKHSIFIIKSSKFAGLKARLSQIQSIKALQELNYSPGRDLFIYEDCEAVKEKTETIRGSKSLVYQKTSEILAMIIESQNKEFPT